MAVTLAMLNMEISWFKSGLEPVGPVGFSCSFNQKTCFARSSQVWLADNVTTLGIFLNFDLRAQPQSDVRSVLTACYMFL